MVKERELRVWWIRNPPNPAWYCIVADAKESRQLLDSLADTDLQNKNVWGNAGGLQVYENGDWHEWYDENGDNIDDSHQFS